MGKDIIALVCVVGVALVLSGCETTSPKGMHVHPKVGLNTLTKLLEHKVTDDDLVRSSHRAADSLIKKAYAACVATDALNTTRSGTANYGQDSSFSGVVASEGGEDAQGSHDANVTVDFFYAPPRGLKALCTGLDLQRSIAAASFVNIDDLSESSSFGRIVSQQLASRLSSHGFQIIEMLLRKSVYIQQQAGEFLLSRELKNISKEHNVQAAIVGTYAVGKNSVYVTAKIVDSANSIVIASHDYELALGPNTRSLLLAE